MRKLGLMAAAVLSVAACAQGGLGGGHDTPYAPSAKTGAVGVDPLLVGHRLMQAGEHDLALAAYTRAAARYGINADTLSAIGTAELALGRLGQAEKHLREAIDMQEDWPELWNNLGVVLMERRKISEAVHIFKRAYAMDNGESDAIRDNLRKALAKMENPSYDGQQTNNYKLVRRGNSEFLIKKAP